MFSIFSKVSCSWQGENPNQTRKDLTNIAQTWVMRFPKSRTCSRCFEASLIFSSLLPCRRGRRWKSSRWRRFTKCRSANRGEWRSLSAGEYVLLIHLGTSEHSCRSGLCSVFCSELMMRDNLFEMVTSSRTFYVQVTHMNRTHWGAAYLHFSCWCFIVCGWIDADSFMKSPDRCSDPLPSPPAPPAGWHVKKLLKSIKLKKYYTLTLCVSLCVSGWQSRGHAQLD